MDITTQISALIETVKKQPNGIARTKVMSHLQDARVWSKELDDKFAGLAEEQGPPSQNSGCICDDIGIRRGCPIHDSN